MSSVWKDVFNRLVKNPRVHARFLNTISLMEYMGARKIVKSQLEKNIDSEVLAHMTEEIRHAQMFKKMALKLSGGELQTYDDNYLLAGAEARAYIQSVDYAVAAALQGQDSHYNYLLSTLLIEERANLVYPYYAELMEPLGFGSYLRNILREEEHHLEQIKSQLLESERLTEAQLGALRMVEDDAFQALIYAINRELKAFELENETPTYLN